MPNQKIVYFVSCEVYLVGGASLTWQALPRKVPRKSKRYLGSIDLSPGRDFFINVLYIVIKENWRFHSDFYI